MIDVTSYFDYDPDLLRAIQPDNWYVENSEPRPDTHYKPAQAIDSEWRIVDADHYEVRSLVKSSSSGGVPVLKFARVKEPAER